MKSNSNAARLSLKALFTVAAMWFSAPTSQAVIFGFDSLTNAGASVEGQFTVDVTLAGDGRISFEFKNSGPIASSISEIYFDDGKFGALEIVNNAGVKFVAGANPGDLPGGNTVGFEATKLINTEADNPSPKNGINSGESLTLLMNVGGYNSFDNVIALMQNPISTGEIRIGLHVQAIGGSNGPSASFVSVSVPDGGATVVLLGLALLGLAFTHRMVAARELVAVTR
jgi:hypothetical protein